MSGVVSELHDRYGNAAFGLVVFLVLWFGVVRPELEASRRAIASIATTAYALESATERLTILLAQQEPEQ